MNEKTWLKMALEELFKTFFEEQGSIVLLQTLEQAAEDFKEMTTDWSAK